MKRVIEVLYMYIDTLVGGMSGGGEGVFGGN